MILIKTMPGRRDIFIFVNACAAIILLKHTPIKYAWTWGATWQPDDHDWKELNSLFRYISYIVYHELYFTASFPCQIPLPVVACGFLAFCLSN